MGWYFRSRGPRQLYSSQIRGSEFKQAFLATVVLAIQFQFLNKPKSVTETKNGQNEDIKIITHLLLVSIRGKLCSVQLFITNYTWYFLNWK